VNVGLSIGLRSLLTAQASLDTIGHNIANANTPGYSRQNIDVSTSLGLNLRGLIHGTGVQADVVRRTTDALLQGRLVRQTATLGNLSARLAAMSEVEAFLGTSAGTGMNVLLQDYFGGLSTLSTAPEDAVLRGASVQSALGLTSRLGQLAGSVEDLRRDTVLRLEGHVEQVNHLAQQIGELNRQISETEAGSLADANDLRDRRDQVIQSLAELVDVKAIEDERGAVRVLVGGFILVSPTTVEKMQLESDPSTGEVVTRISGNTKSVSVTGGAIGGLMNMLSGFLPDLGQSVDGFARALILETNRIHSTGVGADGGFHLLVGTNPIKDLNASGDITDELLANAGLPFDVGSGELFVNLTNETTGEMTKHRIAIDATRTTVGDFATALNGLSGLSASFDGQGRLQVFSDTGYAFDFGARLDANPDQIGSFGGGQASLASAFSEPFTLAAGDTLNLTGPLGAFTVTFNPGGFQQIGQATAGEVAAALNADPNLQANGLAAAVVDGHVVLQTVGSGSAESFGVTGGTALGALGWTAGATVTGHDASVDVAISGEYVGATNGTFTFRPSVDGTIGTTPGLKVQVYDSTGAQIAELDVGAGYHPGDELDVVDGVKVRFAFGELSASNNDLFTLDVVADSDTADVLPALGLNGLFTGWDAATINVSEDVKRDPSLLATSFSGAQGDGGNLLRLLELEGQGVAGLGGLSLDEGWAGIVGSVSLEVSGASGSFESESFLFETLTTRRDQTSGVNVDEEMVKLIEQEQAFTAASQYIRVISDLTAELMNLV
jgi:flagellar hook-associated protein 1 FlgK